MNGPTVSRPVPVPDERSAPFWENASRHVLVVACCTACGVAALPPEVVCPHCGSIDPGPRWTPVDGGGTLRSWTVLHTSFLPGFEELLPLVLLDVALDEHPQIRLIGRLLDGPSAPRQVGAAVRVVFDDVAAGVSLPAFELVR